MKIIGLFPLTGNGGIASWTKKFVKTFPDEEYVFSFVNVAPAKPRSGDHEPLWYRIISGISTLLRIRKEIKVLLNKDKYDILHTTTSGNIGSFRDYAVAKLCHKFGVKTIMHCRYGCITEDIQSSGIIGYMLRKAMCEFDQIWVLDSRSYKTLKGIDYLKDRVHLTPNSIDVTEPLDETPKDYKTIAFCGNLVPSKGLYELTEAATKTDVTLHLIGPVTEEVNAKVREIAGDKLDKTIFLHGRLPNPEAVKFLKSVDMVALPTYYPWEAFPISIIEAFSVGCPVLCTPVGGIVNMIKDGENGMLSHSLSVDDYYFMLKRFSCLPSEERTHMKLMASKSFIRYSIENTALEYLKIYSNSKN